MKRFKDYHIEPIKRCSHQIGDEKVKEWHYKINDVLYTMPNSYVCAKVATRKGDELKAVLTAFYNSPVPRMSQPKKEEILRKGKAIYLQLRQIAQSFQWEPSDTEQIAMVLRYQVRKYLSDKPVMTIEKAVSILNDNKQIYSDYYLDAAEHIDVTSIDTRSFGSMQAELKEFVSSQL